MKWVALDSAHEFGSLYQNGDYFIRHMAVGFGISLCRAYLGSEFQREFTGHNALNDAMAWCQSHEDMDACRERPAQRETATHRAEGEERGE